MDHAPRTVPHLDHTLGAQLFQHDDEVIKLGGGEDALLPAGIHLEQALQVPNLGIHARMMMDAMSKEMTESPSRDPQSSLTSWPFPLNCVLIMSGNLVDMSSKPLGPCSHNVKG